MAMTDLQASPRLAEKRREEISVDGDFEHVENKSTALASPVDDEGDNELLGEKRAVAERRLRHKLDARLLPTIGTRRSPHRVPIVEDVFAVLVFILNYIDRTAVTSARLKGLEQDLGLSGKRPRQG